MITEKVVYVTKGKTFDSLEAAESHRLDLIGEFMDTCGIMLGPGDRIKLAEFVANNRTKLSDLLNY